MFPKQLVVDASVFGPNVEKMQAWLTPFNGFVMSSAGACRVCRCLASRMPFCWNKETADLAPISDVDDRVARRSFWYNGLNSFQVPIVPWYSLFDDPELSSAPSRTEPITSFFRQPALLSLGCTANPWKPITAEPVACWIGEELWIDNRDIETWTCQVFGLTWTWSSI